jgi:hypothetical protein
MVHKKRRPSSQSSTTASTLTETTIATLRFYIGDTEIFKRDVALLDKKTPVGARSIDLDRISFSVDNNNIARY